MGFSNEIAEKVLNGYKITKEDAFKLYSEPEAELYTCANSIREKFTGNKVDLCSIINGKSGRCSENCSYCAQSKHYKTGVKEYPLVSYEEVKEKAKKDGDDGIDRFSIVTSGRGLSTEDLEIVTDYYGALNKELPNISLCASHGILNKDDLIKLKKSGVKRYHHNVETSKNYYSKICTTHTYDERVNTIKLCREVGLEVCSGGIIGLGENREDRINMAIELRELDILSIPINALMPIKGTPLENEELLREEEILRTIAVFRFINPRANIRLAAGRNLLTNYGEKAFMAGANGTISGSLLTTCGSGGTCNDRKMIEGLGLKVKSL